MIFSYNHLHIFIYQRISGSILLSIAIPISLLGILIVLSLCVFCPIIVVFSYACSHCSSLVRIAV